MFTLVKGGEHLEFDELVDVLLCAEVNDPVYRARPGVDGGR